MKHAKNDPSPKNKYSAAAMAGIIITALAVVLFISGAVMFFVSNRHASKNNPPKIPNSATEPSSTASAATEDSAPTRQPITVPDFTLPAPTLPDIENPPTIFLDFLSEAGIDLDAVTDTGTQQLVVVKSSGSSAHIFFFESDGEMWKIDSSLSCRGNVGSGGTAEPGEDGESPDSTFKGFYPIVSAFYQDEAPETGLDTVQMDSESFSGLSDDPSDYSCGFIYRASDDADDSGSDQFFHSGGNATTGDISTSAKKLQSYLNKLDSSKNPYILII